MLKIGPIKMRFLVFLILLAFYLASCKQPSNDEIIRGKVDSVLSKMTLEEKIGQMAQLSSWGAENQPLNTDQSYIEEVKAGRVGSILNVTGSELTRKVQEVAIKESRLGIPLIFGYDVVHGYKTIFPIPLAQASSWDTASVRQAARIAAIEASAAGQNWTYAPMVDITRDPRWGRIAEGFGEDVFLTKKMAIAQIEGFQGNDLSANNTIAACAKHFVAYGAAEGGRDYNTCEVSDRTLNEIYLPPFKVCADYKVASIMIALNDLNGIPSSSSEYLGKILRKDWKYNGVVISDWNSIGELVPQGRAIDANDACKLAIQASIDMDMQGNIYVNQLKELVDEGKISKKQIDDAVRRILTLKFKLGLFDNPYKYCDKEREQKSMLTPENIEMARKMADYSIVLLKNKNALLPLSTETNQRIAVIGPLGDNNSDILGSWRAQGNPENAITLLQGLKSEFKNAQIRYTQGCNISGTDISGFAEAIAVAKSSDIIIAAMGEKSPEINKTQSSSDISLPGMQRELLMELKKTGKPIILVLMNGRPLALNWESENIDAIVEAWFPGIMAGPAITDILSGKYNPSGKLPISFPYVTGQIPVYYNHKMFGRTPLPNVRTTDKYDDAPEEALYPFGYGLSYTNFEYSALKLNKKEISSKDTLLVRVTVANTGNYNGSEVVQLYIRDLIASVTRPVKELKGFKKVYIERGNSVEVIFKITASDLAFYDDHMNYTSEPGEFVVMLGTSSAQCIQDTFILK
jgi:beta-glucosidase